MPQPKTTPENGKELSVRDLAERLKVDARELRKWLRTEGQGVGRGGKRYVFTLAQATQLSRKFKAAQKPQGGAKEQS